MSWQYIIRSGEMLHNGSFYTKCYAGRDQGLNNPDMQYVKDTGPLPVGVYRIGNAVEDSHLGPCAMPLMKDKANEMRGRDGFFIHADLVDARTNPFKASHGCIIVAPVARRYIATCAAAGDRLLTVVAERKDALWVGLPPTLTTR